MKTHAFIIHKHGGPEVLSWEEVDLSDPGPGEVLIRNTAIGLNFADIYLRDGGPSHPAKLPCGLGLEAAGVIEKVGRGVKNFKTGDRVAYAGGAKPGSYAEAALRSTQGLIKLPKWLDDKTAAAALTKGGTVQYLFNRTHKLKKGDTVLFTAVAGGVGLIAVQWAKAVGARLIGTVGSNEKAALARRYGAKEVVVTALQSTADEVMRLTNGQGVDVVYDSVGKDSWEDSLKSVKRRGLVVCFGASSGPPRPYDLLVDGLKGSPYIHRATSVNYMTSDEERQRAARQLFRMMKSGAIKIRISQTYKLRDAPQAQADMQARKTTGSTVLLP
jgi:NADPH2:quinone reductase